MTPAINHSLARYYVEVGRTNPINDAEEERKLIQRWQKNKDQTAREILVKSNLRFVVKMARKRTRNPEKLEDLIAAGNIGLLEAIDRYDLGRRPMPRLLTYAGSWINKEMLDNDYATSSVVHIPTHRQKAQRK